MVRHTILDPDRTAGSRMAECAPWQSYTHFCTDWFGKNPGGVSRVERVIVDEIHAVADDKRGAHLALPLERLHALVCGKNRLSPGSFITGLLAPPQRIGLPATQNPIDLLANSLTGPSPGRETATI